MILCMDIDTKRTLPRAQQREIEDWAKASGIDGIRYLEVLDEGCRRLRVERILLGPCGGSYAIGNEIATEIVEVEALVPFPAHLLRPLAT